MKNRGLSKASEVKEEIIKIDENTAKRYRVVEETIDLQALKAEKENLEAELNMKEPRDKELIEMGKMMHPFYRNKDVIIQRLEELNKLLG
jgi:hypothetical protein